MFDIGGLELLLITVVVLLVIGPERLPETLRMLGLWLGRLRRSFTSVKNEIEKEIGMDEIKRQLHNESVMEEMKRIEREVQSTADQARIDPSSVTGADVGATAADAPAGTADAGAEADRDVASENIASQGPDAGSLETEGQPQSETAPIPQTEAELEALHERRKRVEQANSQEH